MTCILAPSGRRGEFMQPSLHLIAEYCIANFKNAHAFFGSIVLGTVILSVNVFVSEEFTIANSLHYL